MRSLFTTSFFLTSLFLTVPASAGMARPEGAAKTAVRFMRSTAGLRYMAEAGYLAVPGQRSASIADLFYVAYRSRFTSSKNLRPIVFAYNGGPGGSSAAVHIGAFGPRVVAPIEPGQSAEASDRLIDNPDTLLPVADLVFIDPAGSGLSRLRPDADPSTFYGVRPDAAATATFIATYLHQHGDEGRPFFIMGESYGTLRTVLVARLLQQRGMKPAGLILMGLILDNATLFTQPGDDEPYWLFLPSEAATAHFHGKANTGLSLSDTITSAERFSTDRYLVALAQGSSIAPAAGTQVRAILGGLLGMTADSERVAPEQFANRLLGGGLALSRADGRFSGRSTGTGPLADPLYALMLPLYGRAMTRYLRDELGVQSGNYRVLDASVADAWQWGDTPLGSPTSVSVGGVLRDSLRYDPSLAVFVASGIYDLTSPMLAADYTIAHLGGTPSELARITSRRYDSGHMIYVSADTRHQLARDLAAFIGARAALTPTKTVSGL